MGQQCDAHTATEPVIDNYYIVFRSIFDPLYAVVCSFYPQTYHNSICVYLTYYRQRIYRHDGRETRAR